MYEAHFGFRRKPFSLLPDPGFLYLGRRHRTALTLLEYGIENQEGFIVVTGSIGCGKTTLIRHVLNTLQRDITVGLITNTHESFGELLQWVLLAFDLDYRGMGKVGRYKTFVDFIIEEYAQNRRTVLIVDEAQNLSASAVEELRMLSNVNVDKDQVLQLVLVGQPQFLDVLKDPALYQFVQRVAVDYHIDPLDELDTHRYIRHRLIVAGGDPRIFAPETVRLLYEFTRGVPRLINLICDTALVYAYGARVRNVGLSLMAEVIRDRQRRRGLHQSPVATVKEHSPERSDQVTSAVPGQIRR